MIARTVREVALIAGSVCTIAAAGRLLFRRPILWIWRRLVAEPFADFMHRVIATAPAVAEIRHEVQFNNGGSVKDGVCRTEAAVGRIEARLDSGEAKFAEGAARDATLASDVAEMARDLEAIKAGLASTK